MSTIQTTDNTTTSRKGPITGLLLGGAAVLALAACGDPATADQGPPPDPSGGVSQEWLAARSALEQRAVPESGGVSQEWLAGRNAETTRSVPLTGGASQEWKAYRETFGD